MKLYSSRRTTRNSLSLGLIAVTLVGLGLPAQDAHAFGRKRENPLPGVRAEKVVPKVQTDQLKLDYEWLKTLQTTSIDPELVRVMGLGEASPDALNSSLQSWLGERVQYIIAEDFKPSLWNLFPYLFSKLSYPNPEVLPDLEQPGELPPGLLEILEVAEAAKAGEQPVAGGELGQTEARTVMSNLGAALYMGGKMSKIIMGLRMRGIGRIPVTSPRVGAIMVGEGLFYDGYFDGKFSKESPVRSAFRMATFFHEARHSDGNGKSLGFVHAICPPGHDYEGLNACDRNTNGPYTVGALMEKHMAENCAGCTEGERAFLQVMALESRSRIIPQRTGEAPQDWDPTPEAVF